MVMPSEKVELGFDDNFIAGNFFTLDNATRGLLDGATYVLSGGNFYDATQYVKSIAVSRGKSRELDRFQAGRLNVTFDNRNRYFDPTYTSSPFYGQIVPRRTIRYSVNNVVQFTGLVDDWNLNFTPDGQSTAEAVGVDGFALLAQQTLTGGTATSQLSGARINTVLNDAGVNWSATNRNIDSGQETLQADVVTADSDVLSYINLIEQTEPGVFFMDKNNYATFKDRASIKVSGTVPVFSDSGTGIPYSQVRVVYGSELLFNQAVMSRLGGATVQADDVPSQTTYGVRTLTQKGLLHSSDTALANLAVTTVAQYRNPEFRFEAVMVDVHALALADQNTVLGLEIGQICNISFTPNGIAPSISKYAEVLGVSHDVGLDHHHVTFMFQTVDLGLFILDDSVFGLLDLSLLGY